jgi:quercetin dioxygenase-like cupin family protein
MKRILDLHRITSTSFLATLAGGFALAASSAALAQDSPLPEGFETQSIVDTTTTRDGDALRWPEGEPKIVSVIGTIEPGGRTPLHQHPVPTFVYVLEGEVELRTEGGDPQVYSEGGAYIESLDRDHQLFNETDAPARVLVVFVTADGTRTTVAAN